MLRFPGEVEHADCPSNSVGYELLQSAHGGVGGHGWTEGVRVECAGVRVCMQSFAHMYVL